MKGRHYTPGQICYKTSALRDTPCEQCAFQKAIEQGKIIRHTIQIDQVDFEVTATPVYDNEGIEIIGGLLRFEDITEKVKMDKMLQEAKEKAEAMLRYFRLPEPLWDLYPNTFSGGERLRLNLAHTMVKQPRLMLLDEPTASLDNKTKILVKDMLMQLKEKGTSMIGIFHDLEFMDGLCDKVFNISEGTFQ